MTKYDQVDVLLSQQIPGWQNDWLDSWLVEKAKARWADSHPIEDDGTPEHVDYIITYMAKVTTLPDDQLDKVLQHAAGGIYRGPGSSKRVDKIRAKQAAKGPGPDEYVGAGETLRLMRPEEAAEIAQRNRSRHRFMTPERVPSTTRRAGVAYGPHEPIQAARPQRTRRACWARVALNPRRPCQGRPRSIGRAALKR
jgi:hypothetical protein